jgi:hypothetical protein
VTKVCKHSQYSGGFNHNTGMVEFICTGCGALVKAIKNGELQKPEPLKFIPLPEKPVCKHKHVNWVKQIMGDGYFQTCLECNAILTNVDEPNSILVLSESHHQFYQYRFHRCQAESKTRKYHVKVDSGFGKQFIDGSSGMFHGFHFKKIVITGTFWQGVDAVKIMQYAKAVLDDGGEVIDETQGLPANMTKPKPVKLMPKPFLLPKKNEEPKPLKHGEVRKLPKSNSPMWTEQWAAQGSAKLPYIVSKKSTGYNNAMTDEGWACSCPNFTQNTPRADCKHICWVKKSENIPLSNPASTLPPDQQEAFKKFLLEQAQKGQPALKTEGKPKPFVTQGRRFR